MESEEFLRGLDQLSEDEDHASDTQMEEGEDEMSEDDIEGAEDEEGEAE